MGNRVHLFKVSESEKSVIYTQVTSLTLLQVVDL